ncbi:amidohydrolase family protein [Catenuloplanes atrovinosus]|uniref:Imidazolonepropionase-like amidohydrolase n=1 Tax=Catenuloplanes atrovinosus TaxID=137266 RepID=A0AAE4CAI1_9ACTN|nr:amidohydrolase family protein [Catenuloplanes atrovinosus]MDR7277002.1 imidazolonepropionase-like amidohydrolase [Catenuloplanes atrovinosus]
MSDRTALTNIRVFDGERLTEPRTVVVDGGLIGDDPTGAAPYDGGGAVLLPGLIDAHVHLHGRETLDRLAAHGVTTGLDMASWPAGLAASLRGVPGTADLRSAGLPVIGPAGPHSHLGMPAEAVLTDPDHAERYVETRLADGADYIKIVLEAPGEGGPDPAAATAVVSAAHARGRIVVAHAASAGAYALALDIGADVVTHVPLGPPLDGATAARVAADGRVAVPTLTIMEELARALGRAEAYAGAARGVGELHRAGVPILAGTDANAAPGSPSPVPHGESMHRELELLVDAGLTPAEALRAATVLPARHFGLADRGAVRPGLRADLLLIDGDPLADIRATRGVVRVWCGGVPFGG